MKPFDIAMISVHSSPTGRLGTRDTGGMSVYIRELAAVFGRLGHRVDIFTRAGDGAPAGRPRALSENVRLVPLEFGAAAGAPKEALHPYLERFFGALEDFRAAQRIDYDLVHSHYWLSGLVGRTAQQAWGVPHLCTFHTLGALKRLVAGAEGESAARIAAERRLTATADRVLVTSARERDNLLRYYEAPPAKVSLVPCGVNLDLFRSMAKGIARRRTGADLTAPLLLYVGRFAPEKGLERLIRAMSGLGHIPRLRLVVVGGDGGRDPATRKMKELSRASGAAGSIRFVGRVDQKELPSYYSAADLLVLPSGYESFGMAAIEAMACGTPVVATRVGAMEEIVRSGINGELVDGFNPSAIADTVSGWLLRSPGSPPHSTAIRRSVRRFDWARIAAKVLKVYAEVMTPIAGAADGGHTGPAACCGCGRVGRV